MTSYQHLKATIRIGKQGLTKEVLSEIAAQLKKHGIVKIKMLPSYTGNENKKQHAIEITQKTGTKLLHSVGGVLVIEDPSFKKSNSQVFNR